MDNVFSIGKLRASRPGKQFNLVIDEEPLDNALSRVAAHYPVEIWLWSSPEGKEGLLAPTTRRCSAGCLKYRQCILEECESDVQYRPYHNTRCRTSVVVHNAVFNILSPRCLQTRIRPSCVADRCATRQ
ncbi:hypothetical protein TNCV_1845891 [Trichonephila clavipes]|nr:hypothetical protein TNCV_1845891 [Trichonephila clavipes]